MLNRKGIKWLHLPNRATGKKRGQVVAGYPDLTWVQRCRVKIGKVPFEIRRPIACELKQAGKSLDPAQVICLAEMRRDGWEVYCCRSVDMFSKILSGTAEELTDAELI